MKQMIFIAVGFPPGGSGR